MNKKLTFSDLIPVCVKKLIFFKTIHCEITKVK